jgi:hypothetical protein
MITQDELKACLNYNPNTGEFHWKVKPCKRFPAGMKAGAKVNGYIRIKIKDKAYGAHRLAWLYVHGEHPEHQIDHINGNPSDNRITNLRKATQFENAQNRRKPQKNNPHGMLGITYDPHKKLWKARIGINGKRKYIGKYKSQEEAAQAYIDAKRLLHPFNTL